MTQVIKKRRIVLASVLKPVDDTRMFEKLGATLYDSNRFDVTIIAYPSNSQISHSGITLKPINRFSRLSFKRLLAQWKVLQIINQVKPELIIINTPELLLVAFINRIFFGRKIIYDVLENYYTTIRFTQTYPSFLRPMLACMVRITEVISRSFVSQYFLAEKGYEKEIRFAQPYAIIENKFPKALAKKFSAANQRGYSKLIFTGTMAPTTGVLEAIQLFKELRKVDSTFTLTIVGYCSIPSFLEQVCREIDSYPSIKLIGGDRLVPHSEILTAIGNSDAGIIIYSINPSTKSSIPTKLYEYLAMNLPVLIQHNDASHRLVKKLNAGFILKDVSSLALVDRLKTNHFYSQNDASIYWEAEVPKLLDCLNLL